MASHARNAVWTGGLAILLALICLPGQSAAPASADQLLLNAGFESGSSSWSGPGFSVSANCARSGSSGGLLSASIDDLSATAAQTISPASMGSYALRGYVKLAPGAVTPVPVFTLVFNSYQTSGLIRKAVQPVTVTANWVEFTMNFTEMVPDLRRIRLDLVIGAAVATSVCLDDLSLEGPALATSTPVPTSTPLPTDTPIPTASPTPTAQPATETPVPTAGPAASATTAPSGTSTPVPATAAPVVRPTMTPVPPGPSFVFANGGFEEGVAAWQKFGGELRAVSNPRNSGSFAGALASSTNSTKWAYQVVRVDPALVYEFNGALMPGDGVSAAYLRISWYASSDGSGAAVATDDSTARASGSSNDFVRLTTGPKSPPPAARSARVRVLLTPSSAASATLYIDDVWFGAVTSPTTPPPPSASVAPDELPEPTVPFQTIATPSTSTTPDVRPSPGASESPTPRASSTARAAASVTATTTPGRSEPAAVQRVTTPMATFVSGQPNLEPSEEPEDDRSFELIAGSAVLFGAAGAGAFLWAKKRPGAPV